MNERIFSSSNKSKNICTLQLPLLLLSTQERDVVTPARFTCSWYPTYPARSQAARVKKAMATLRLGGDGLVSTNDTIFLQPLDVDEVNRARLPNQSTFQTLSECCGSTYVCADFGTSKPLRLGMSTSCACCDIPSVWQAVPENSKQSQYCCLVLNEVSLFQHHSSTKKNNVNLVYLETLSKQHHINKAFNSILALLGQEKSKQGQKIEIAHQRLTTFLAVFCTYRLCLSILNS